jgi:hypothetical protein
MKPKIALQLDQNAAGHHRKANLVKLASIVLSAGLFTTNLLLRPGKRFLRHCFKGKSPH